MKRKLNKILICGVLLMSSVLLSAQEYLTYNPRVNSPGLNLINYSKIHAKFKNASGEVISDNAFYCLLIFGEKAKIKMWVVADKSSPDIKGYDQLYVDLDYDGIVGEEGEFFGEMETVGIDMARYVILKNWKNPSTGEINDAGIYFLKPPANPTKLTNDDVYLLTVSLEIRGYKTACKFQMSSNTSKTAKKLWVGFEKPLAVMKLEQFNTQFYKGTGEVKGGLYENYFANNRTFMLAYPGSDNLAYWSMSEFYLDTKEHLVSEVEYTTLSGKEEMHQGKLEERCCGIKYYGAISFPYDAKAGEVLLRVSAQESTKSIVKIIPFETKVVILDKNPTPPQRWVDLGWRADATPEENKEKIKETTAALEAKTISGVEEVEYRVLEPVLGEGISFKAGEIASVLVMVTVKDGFHTYGPEKGTGYVNTKMNWNLPDGFTVKEVQWPKPKIVEEGDNEVPVYENKFSLNVFIQTPKTAKPGNVYTIGINTSFQYCNQWTCQLGEANNTIQLKAVE